MKNQLKPVQTCILLCPGLEGRESQFIISGGVASQQNFLKKAIFMHNPIQKFEPEFSKVCSTRLSIAITLLMCSRDQDWMDIHFSSGTYCKMLRTKVDLLRFYDHNLSLTPHATHITYFMALRF